jgi:DNA-binding transcriptional ArsR family regulator
MDDIPPIYNIESVEQLRAISDRLRGRIIDLLAHQPMTVAQLSNQLHLAHAKVHYHVRELEHVKVVRLVEKREKGGILEKYYRAAGRSLVVPPALLGNIGPDEAVGIAAQLLQQLTSGFLRALGRVVAKGSDEADISGIDTTSLFLTRDELKALSHRLLELLKPYETPRGHEGEREVTLLQMYYTDDDQDDQSSPLQRPAAIRSPSPPHAIARPRDRTAITVGASEISRDQLERLARQGERLAIYALGAVSFADDIPAELVDRVVRRARIRGKLVASPEVRAVLKRKEE